MIRSYVPAPHMLTLGQKVGAVSLWLGQACAVVVSVIGFASADDFRPRPLVISIGLALTFIFILAIPVFREWRRKEQFTSQLENFGKDIVDIAPTPLGWLVIGEDWIGTTVYPSEVKKILFSEIDDIFWGDPHGRWRQIGKTHSFNLPKDAVNQNTGCFWLVLSCSHDPQKNLVCTFGSQKTRDRWLQVCKHVVENGTLPVLEQARPWPSTTQIVWKTKIPLACFRCGVLSLCSVLALLACTYHWKHVGGFAVLWWPLWSSTFRPFLDSARNLYLAFEASFAGLSETLKPGTPVLSNGKLYLSIEHHGVSFPEIIPVEKIRDMRLDQWGTVFTNRDLLQLFNRNAKPIYRTLVLTLDDADHPERRIQLGAEQAESIFASLQSQKREASTYKP